MQPNVEDSPRTCRIAFGMFWGMFGSTGWSTDQFVGPQSDSYRSQNLSLLRSPLPQEELFIEGELDLMTSTKNTKKPHPHRLPFPLD